MDSYRNSGFCQKASGARIALPIKIEDEKIFIQGLFTNTACGYLMNRSLVEKLYKEYKDKNFIVIGFPSNNFLWQEPGTDDQIAEFCKENYGVSFPMMSKISVKGS